MSEFINGNGRAEGTGAPAKTWEKTIETDKIETTETASEAAPASHDPKALDAHAAAGHHLFPIDGKKPVGHGWTRSAPISLDQAKARYKAGKNVGVRLRPTDLVIDVDPRHFA